MEKVMIDITKLCSVKNWASNYGIVKSGKPYTASYAYKLFSDETSSPTALEVKEKFALITIDGVNFIIERKYIPSKVYFQSALTF